MTDGHMALNHMTKSYIVHEWNFTMNLSRTIQSVKENNYLVVLIIILIILTGVNAVLMMNKSSDFVSRQIHSNSKVIGDNKQTDLTKLQESLNSLVIRLDAIEKQNHEFVEKLNRVQLSQKRSKPNQSEQAEFSTNVDSTDWQDSSEAQPDSIESYDQAMLQEPIDENWKMQLDVQINNILSEVESADTAVHSMECRESTCRVEFLHTDAQAESAWLETMTSSEFFSGEMYAESSVNESGETITLIYMSKP